MIAWVFTAVLAGPSPQLAPLAQLVDSSTCSAEELDAIIAGRRELVGLAELHDAVRDSWAPHAGDPGWPSRARWRGLVPRVDASLGTDTDLDVRDTLDDRTIVEGRALGVRVGARFELGDLVFSEAELRARRELASREDALRQRLVEVTQLYFQRVEVLLALRLDPSAVLLVRARTLDGLIAALTGGRVPTPR